MAVKFLINILEMTWEIKMKGFPKRKDIHKVLQWIYNKTEKTVA